MDSGTSTLDSGVPSDTAVLEALRDDIAAGQIVAYFGYGSLVNRATLRTRIRGAMPARLTGWRRIWRPRPLMANDAVDEDDIAVLTVRRDAASATDGLLVFDHVTNLPDVDLREARYHRRSIEPSSLTLAGTLPDALPPLFVYEAYEGEHGVDRRAPILRSYLDAVMQGFLKEYGESGLRRFIAETDDFDVTPVFEDRDAPRYPRSVQLSQAETALFDMLAPRRT